MMNSYTYNGESRNRKDYFSDYRKKNREKLRAYKKKWKEDRKAKERERNDNLEC